MHRLHPYPDVQVMFRRLLIATLIGLLAALAVALFRHAMVVLETLLLSNDSGSSRSTPHSRCRRGVGWLPPRWAA